MASFELVRFRPYIVQFLMAISLSISFTSSPVLAQQRCVPSDIVVVDRSRFSTTIQRATTVLRDHGRLGLGRPYTESFGVDAFATEIADLHPRIIIAHYSMFAPGRRDRGRFTARFLNLLQSRTTRPIYYVLYSSSFYDPQKHTDGRTLASLRKQDGLSDGIGDAQITLIHVEDDRGRFTRDNGAKALGDVIDRLALQIGCVR